ncbi:MAG: hypothetical protein NUV53_00835 [Patescibacteria group bacterium]|nr:hypothetical protein [Patescibacteria group bacterium]
MHTILAPSPTFASILFYLLWTFAVTAFITSANAEFGLLERLVCGVVGLFAAVVLASDGMRRSCQQ